MILCVKSCWRGGSVHLGREDFLLFERREDGRHPRSRVSRADSADARTAGLYAFHPLSNVAGVRRAVRAQGGDGGGLDFARRLRAEQLDQAAWSPAGSPGPRPRATAGRPWRPPSGGPAKAGSSLPGPAFNSASGGPSDRP